MDKLETLELVEAIVEAGPAVIFRWKIEPGLWPVEYVSKNISQFGYTRKDMISGKVSWFDITHPDDCPRLEKEVEGFLAKKQKKFSQNYRIRNKKGDYCWVRDWNFFITDKTGEPTHVQGIIIDISKEKTEIDAREKAEKQLQNSLANVISELVPICAKCKAIKGENDKWMPIESYLDKTSLAKLTHCLCDKCFKQTIAEMDD